MGRILTQEEIDALLATPPDAAAAGSRHDAALAGVPYNFRRPDRVSKEQLYALHMLHDRFARIVSTSMSAFLRTLTELSVTSVEQRAYSEFLATLPDPTAFYAIGVAAVDEIGALEIDPVIAFAMIDRMLGGTGQTTAPGRALTEIEQHVIDSAVALLLDALSEAWKQITDLQFDVRARDTRPQMLQVAAPNETVLMVVFEMRVGEARGPLHLCLPASLVESSGSPFGQAWNRQRRRPTDAERRWVTESLSRVPMDICAQVESTVNAHELLGLGPGDVLSLGVPAHKPIDVHIGQTLKFKGRLSVDGDRVGLMVESHATAGTAVEV